MKIDIEEDGSVYVATSDEEAGLKAISIIEGIVGDVEVGTIFEGKVTRIMNFGAFVEFLPAKKAWFISQSLIINALTGLKMLLMWEILSPLRLWKSISRAE